MGSGVRGNTADTEGGALHNPQNWGKTNTHSRRWHPHEPQTCYGCSTSEYTTLVVVSSTLSATDSGRAMMVTPAASPTRDMAT